MVTALIGTIVIGAWEGVEIDNAWYWPNYLGYTVAAMWLAFEAIHSYSGARKRNRIGLCEAAVVNRYLLWSCFGVFQVLACAAVIFMAVQVRADGGVSTWSDSLVSGTEIASIVMLWLAFFPPAAYLNWVSNPGNAAADSPAEG
jgi:hypothetical protein